MEESLIFSAVDWKAQRHQFYNSQQNQNAQCPHSGNEKQDTIHQHLVCKSWNCWQHPAHHLGLRPADPPQPMFPFHLHGNQIFVTMSSFGKLKRKKASNTKVKKKKIHNQCLMCEENDFKETFLLCKSKTHFMPVSEKVNQKNNTFSDFFP